MTERCPNCGSEKIRQSHHAPSWVEGAEDLYWCRNCYTHSTASQVRKASAEVPDQPITCEGES